MKEAYIHDKFKEGEIIVNDHVREVTQIKICGQPFLVVKT